MVENGKLNIGIFSFTGDEGCVITLVEALNDYIFKWKDFINVKYARVLQRKNKLEDIDVAIVEGAMSSKNEISRLEEIRKNSKKLVALGSCAIDGTPSNHRNFFLEPKLGDIMPLIKKFDLNVKVEPLNKFVKVDDVVPGCPMIPATFLNVMYKYFEEFGLKVPR